MKAIEWCCRGGLKQLLTRENTTQLHPNFTVFSIFLSDKRECKPFVCLYTVFLIDTDVEHSIEERF